MDYDCHGVRVVVEKNLGLARELSGFGLLARNATGIPSLLGRGLEGGDLELVILPMGFEDYAGGDQHDADRNEEQAEEYVGEHALGSRSELCAEAEGVLEKIAVKPSVRL